MLWSGAALNGVHVTMYKPAMWKEFQRKPQTLQLSENMARSCVTRWAFPMSSTVRVFRKWLSWYFPSPQTNITHQVSQWVSNKYSFWDELTWDPHRGTTSLLPVNPTHCVQIIWFGEKHTRKPVSQLGGRHGVLFVKGLRNFWSYAEKH